MRSAQYPRPAHYHLVLLCVIAVALACRAPAQQEETGWGMHKRMFAVPTPDNITIDGSLADWDLSGAIEMYVMAATKDVQGATFAIQFDAEALYVGAEVRDTTPLMNRHAPEAEGDMAWDADACQFRLVLDPSQGYPVTDTTWKREPNDQLVHLLLWYYTDRKEPNLQVHRSMRYESLPGAEKFGVMQRSTFQAAYRLMDDGRGYVLEYRIPWKTLEAKRPPTGGDVTASTMQINWGRADGLKTAGYGAWGYDLMAFPGFAYQNAGCWGKLLFSKTGDLSPELVNEGLPPQKPLPLTFAFDLPEDAETSIALYNGANEVVRTVIAQSRRAAGHNQERWDGLDELGQPLPAGTYPWKGLYHAPITQNPVLSVHNSGQPPWKTDANDGGWGGDHGVPVAVVASGNELVLAWNSAEAGWGLIRTDGEGKKRWGTLRAAEHMATDGQRLYVAYGREVNACEFKDFRPLPFDSGAAALAPPPGSAETDAVTGLACAGGKLYVAFGAGNVVGVYDALQGNCLAAWPVPAPGPIAVRPSGDLAMISGSQLVAVALADGAITPLGREPLEQPAGLAVDADGALYVACGGARQNVAVLAPNGAPVRSIGKPGGRPAVGRYDSTGMLAPAGLAVDAQGRLWVMEAIDAPKRVSVWETKTGALVKEFFGGAHYSAHIWMDPERPDEVYCDGALWKVDLDAGTSYPYSTVWRPRGPDSPGMFNTHGGGLRMFTARNGKQYGFASDSYHAGLLLLRDGDVFKPLLGFIWTQQQPAVAAVYPDHPHGATLVWVDRNDDQVIQSAEIGPQVGPSWYRQFSWVDADLNLWHPSGEVYRPLRIAADGRPEYDFAKPEKIAMRPDAVDPQDGAIYSLRPGALPGKGIGFSRHAPDGTLQWGYRGVIEWPAALSLPPQRPGKLWGPTTLLGTAGDYTGVNTYFGSFHLYTRQEGLCVAKLFSDPRLAAELGPDLIACENMNGQLVRPKGMDRYFALGGDQDGRITEVFGLDTVKRLPGGTLTITDAEAQAVAAAYADYQARLARGQKLILARGRKALGLAQAVNKTVNQKQSFEIRAAYDTANLYVEFTITSPAELVNGIPDYRTLFKGGNCLDIQIAAEPTAAPERTTPAPGDVRVLVTRQDGKPFAVVYRPKVKGFDGQPIVLTSPTGTESFDRIDVSDKVGLDYEKSPGINAFKATVTLPLELLGWTPQPGAAVRMDVGYIFGNATGMKATARSYWSNNGFAANVLDDIPNESRLAPHEWGQAEVE